MMFTSDGRLLGESPGLVVMGGGSCSKARVFKSVNRMDILNTYFCCKNCNGFMRRRRNPKKGPGMAQF